jgi:asparagine synthase (glutamine-hydrolysing)
MCGISGLFDTSGHRPVDEAMLRRITDIVTHRGPDGSGLHLEPGVGLGHRRLSIIDIATGQQPLGNEDASVWITFNGEIYNYRELREELLAAGHSFRTRSDTETIVHAWEQWGEDCVKRFSGMFAFAIWDARQETLFIARDRLGKKPVYYSLLPNGWFAFGSELKQLMALPALRRTLDPRAIEEYFAFGYVPDPRSILLGTQKLPPGHTLTVRRGDGVRPRLREYWDVGPHFLRSHGLDDVQACEALIAQLRSAVDKRLVAEVPLGAFLSGGVDSSAVVAQMASLMRDRVKTCSIAFGDPRFDETAFAERVAVRYGTDHSVERVDIDDFDLLDSLIDVYDEPYADSSAIPTYRVCQLARRRVTVALSGDAGDENFAGYRRYRWHMAEERVRAAMPLRIRRAIFGPLGRLYPPLGWAPRPLRARATLQALARDGVQAYCHSVSLLDEATRRALFSDQLRRDLDGHEAVDVFRRHAERVPGVDPLSLVQYLDFKTYLPGDILTKVDRASMAHSLEVRVPMLDHEFVEWAAALAPEQKLRHGEGKYILKRSLEPLLPHDLLYRQKMGFAVPIAQWFRDPLRERVRSSLLGPTLQECGLFNSIEIGRLLDEHEAGRRDNSPAIWALMMFAGFWERLSGNRGGAGR